MSASRYYSDEFLIERGRKASLAMASKARKGELPGCAPVGYRNERTYYETRIVLDEAMAPLVREAFDPAAEGKYPLRALLVIMAERGLRSRTGKLMGISSFWHMLTNPFYVGQMRYGHEIKLASHEALVGHSIFEQVQRQIHGRRRG